MTQKISEQLHHMSQTVIKCLQKAGIDTRVSSRDQRIIRAYIAKFGGLPVDGGFTVEAARECLRTGKNFYDRFPKDVNP